MGLTAIIVTSVIGLIIVADVYLITAKGKHHSISAWIIRHSKAHPIFPFAIGIAMGHLFWRMNTLDIYDCKSDYIKEIMLQCEAKEGP